MAIRSTLAFLAAKLMAIPGLRVWNRALRNSRFCAAKSTGAFPALPSLGCFFLGQQVRKETLPKSKNFPDPCFFRFLCFFWGGGFPIFLAFFVHFPSFSKDLRGSVLGKTLASFFVGKIAFSKKARVGRSGFLSLSNLQNLWKRRAKAAKPNWGGGGGSPPPPNSGGGRSKTPCFIVLFDCHPPK